MTTHWADIQEKTFTRWINDSLRQRGMKIDNVTDDLKDGLALCNLLEILSKKKIKPRFNKHPRIDIQKMENITYAIDFVKAQGITLVNIGTTDIVGGNKRIILGLIWALIYFFEICQGDPNHKNAKNDLLEWVRAQIPEYHAEHPINNFKGKTWYNGKALTALCDALVPKNSKGQRANFDYDLDWTKLESKNKLENCTQGIDCAYDYLQIDKLLEGDEMCQKKCDELSVMTYIAQFRNINESLLEAPEEEEIPQIDAATLCSAYGPGLVEAIAGEGTEFFIQAPMCGSGDENKEHDLVVKIEGPCEVDWKKDDNKDGTFTVSYAPTEPGEYTVSVTVDGNHIPGSVFHVLVLEDESLGGEGKIRVYFSTTSSSAKAKSDRYSLERLLTTKKVHLRSDFEPWQPVDLMAPKDRNAVFKKAGTRTLPIVFVDDEYIGDYDKLQGLEEEGQLDDLLAIENQGALLTEEEHLKRLHNQGAGEDKKTDS